MVVVVVVVIAGEIEKSDFYLDVKLKSKYVITHWDDCGVGYGGDGDRDGDGGGSDGDSGEFHWFFSIQK